MQHEDTNGISIVGMALNYADAKSSSELWDLVMHQRTGFRAIPNVRMIVDDYLPRQGREEADTSYVTQAGLITDWQFDANRFRIPKATFETADTAHWLALDTAQKLLSEIGSLDATLVPRATTGVILGNSLGGEVSRANSLRLRWPSIERTLRKSASEDGIDLPDSFLRKLAEDFKGAFPRPNDESLSGTLSNTIAGRICNYFDFHGTGYTIDGACSSSLLAVIHAQKALLNGELDVAIAGGVDISLDPLELVGFSRLGAVSSGEMRIYDASPTGFVPGEGCGLVALMRTRDALEQGLPIYAQVLGGGSSTDGAGGLTRPSTAGHLLAAERAYRQAQIDPKTVGLFEGHGTGTAVGDPTEIGVFNELQKGAGSRAALGSIKANIGHTKAAAGIAGLIKATLAIHHKILPPTSGVRVAHEALEQSKTLVILPEPKEWQGTRVAGVSAMGFGGINTHVVLGQAPATTDKRQRRPTMLPSTKSGPDEVWYLHGNSVEDLIAKVSSATQGIGDLSDGECRDLALHSLYGADLTAGYRAAFAFRSRNEAHRALQESLELLTRAPSIGITASSGCIFEQGQYSWLAVGDPARVGLLFPGQAAPTTLLGSILGDFAGDSALGVAGRSLISQPGPGQSFSLDTREGQPVVLGSSLLGLSWLNRLGVNAHLAIGHSLGEITSMVWAGMLTAKEAAQLVRKRANSMSEFGQKSTSMMSIATDAPMAQRLCDQFNNFDGFEDPITIAALNSKQQTVLAGKTSRLQEFQELARRQGLQTAFLPVSHAFHSAAMSAAVPSFEAALSDIEWKQPERPIYSTVTGDAYASPTSTSSSAQSHLLAQLTQPVNFLGAVNNANDHADLFVECGPGRILSTIVRAEYDKAAIPLETERGTGGFAKTLAALLAAGAISSLSAWLESRHGRAVRTTSPQFITNPCGSVSDEIPQPETAGSTTHESVPLPLIQGTDQLSAALDLDENTSVRAVLTALTDKVRDVTGLAFESEITGLSFSRDLHLNSLQVGQVIAAVITQFAKESPSLPLSFSDATLAEAAEAIHSLPAFSGENLATIPSAAAWSGSFVDEWTSLEPSDDTDWQKYAWTSRGHELSDQGLGNQKRGLLIDLRNAKDIYQSISQGLIEIGNVTDWDAVLVVHLGGAAAVARSVFVETGGQTAVAAIETAVDPLILFNSLPEISGFADLKFDGENWYERISKPFQPTTIVDVNLGQNDLTIVTGGLAGITAECAAELARQTSTRLLFVGRTPEDADLVAEKLRDLNNSGLVAHYVQADLTNRHDIDSVFQAAASMGSPRGLIHGAGINNPKRLSDVTARSLSDTDEVKTKAFEMILSAWPKALPPTLVATFGSIIGRAGIAGQLDYALANDRLRYATEAAALRLQGNSVVRHFEWSVWAQVGMGVTLGVLDDLVRSGVFPLAPEQGRLQFVRNLAFGGPTTRLITSRFPLTKTVKLSSQREDPVRYVENVLIHIPGGETIVEAELTTATDVALADHKIDGIPILPAVAGLEAIAQAAGQLEPSKRWLSFANIDLSQPIVCDAEDRVAIRTAVALTDFARSTMTATIRSSSDGFAKTAIQTKVVEKSKAPDTKPPEPSLEAKIQRQFYGPLFFHGPAFQRLVKVDHASAHRLTAYLLSEQRSWFSSFFSQKLLLGDPGLLDASIHVLQICYPSQRLLPVGAESLNVYRHASENEVVKVEALEQLPAVDSHLTFDVMCRSTTGEALFEWKGLRLKKISSLETGMLDPILLGAHLSRRVQELGWGPIDIGATTMERSSFEASGLLAVDDVWRTPSGRLQADAGFVSTSSEPNVRLTAFSPNGHVGVDVIQDYRGADSPVLSPDDAAVAAALNRSESNFILWVARECLMKNGSTANIELLENAENEIILKTCSGNILIHLQVDGLIGGIYVSSDYKEFSKDRMSSRGTS